MGLTVYWTDFSKSELKRIFDYHRENVSLKIARQITKQIISKADSLGDFSEIGVVEEFLKDRPQKFKYTISTNYKIIYWINEVKKRVEIMDVFDTRQNLTKITRAK